MKSILRIGIALALFAACGCNKALGPNPSVLTRGGNPRTGRHEIEYYGCASCHVVPGVAGANGLIGPSLKQVADRVYIGGVIKNTPDNLIRWIKNAPAVDPKTAMPDLEIPDQQARDIASYLYTLE